MSEYTTAFGNPVKAECSKPEKPSLLYKYLDVNGAVAMLANSNIQFTHAINLNDPFDCHPGLIENSDDMMDITPERLAKIAEMGGYGYFSKENRDYTYVCSLSKIFDSILMWSYYTNAHRGVCIGLNMQSLNKSFKFIDFDVEYPDSLIKYNAAIGTNMEAFKHQLATKAPEWKHEKEVRLLIPPVHQQHTEDHRYFEISRESFAVIYLGANISGEDSGDIITIARRLNPNIKIYKMIVNPDAFKLDYVQI